MQINDEFEPPDNDVKPERETLFFSDCQVAFLERGRRERSVLCGRKVKAIDEHENVY